MGHGPGQPGRGPARAGSRVEVITPDTDSPGRVDAVKH
jgi:hypothetical protein